MQWQDLTELEHQHQDIVFPEPRWTHLIQYFIKTWPGVVIREEPYRMLEAQREATEAEVADISGIQYQPWPIKAPRTERGSHLPISTAQDKDTGTCVSGIGQV